MINWEQRVRTLNNKAIKDGPVLYWLSRDQRLHDNWALLSAQALAFKNKQPLIIAFCLLPKFLGATARQYDFMLAGLQELAIEAKQFNISFQIVSGKPVTEIPGLCKRLGAGAVFTDFSPLRLSRLWKKGVGAKLGCAFFEVDAHNIVPVWLASQKQEFGAYTLRPKINRLLSEYLQPFPKLKKHPLTVSTVAPDWKKLRSSLTIDESIGVVKGFISGEKAAQAAMKTFLKNGLSGYSQRRNDPSLAGQSNLSPYLHFGQLSAQTLALAVMKAAVPLLDREAFLEELIVRRELADNFCLYNDNYDNPDGFPDWAKRSLAKHFSDNREYNYSRLQLERGLTHDVLWNAAQQEMLKNGKMHGYLRMYWAKKILEWTPDLKTAMKIAIYLNDKYELDGRDPNGYAGIAWSLGGVHDRAWFERPVFGQIRYMNDKGCRRKFDVDAYIKKFS